MMAEPNCETKSIDAKHDPSSSDASVTESGRNEEEEKIIRRVARRMDLLVLPVVILLYFFAFLDRANIGNAKVAGFQKALGISNHQYSVALTVFYVGYIIVDIPSNIYTRKIGARRHLPTIAILWGMVTMCQGAVRNYSSLIACRFFLGIFEGGLTPSLLLYMSSFYRRGDLQIRVSMLFAATSCAGAFSGLLAAAIVNLDGVGGHHGWEFIFYLEGAATILLGFICYFTMPNTPSEVPFIKKEDLAIYTAALEKEWTSEKIGDFTWEEFFSVFRDPQFWFMTPVSFANGATLYGLSFFLAPVVQSLGYSPNKTQLMSVPPFAASAIVSLIAAYVSDKYRQRGLTAALSSVIAVVGYAIFYAAKGRGISYLALFFQVIGVYATAPATSAWLANNTLPHYKRAIILAWGFGVTATGGILSAWLYNDPPRYPKGNKINLAMAIVMIAGVIGNRLYLRDQNKRKEAIIASGDFDDSPEARKKLGDHHPRFKYYL